MNRLQIKLFLTLAENKNFTKTANAHNTTQPTVSRQIQMLEEELGTRLFNRNRRSIHITKSGEAYYKLFQKWKNELITIQKKYPPENNDILR